MGVVRRPSISFRTAAALTVLTTAAAIGVGKQAFGGHSASPNEGNTSLSPSASSTEGRSPSRGEILFRQLCPDGLKTRERAVSVTEGGTHDRFPSGFDIKRISIAGNGDANWRTIPDIGTLVEGLNGRGTIELPGTDAELNVNVGRGFYGCSKEGRG
ncbi:MAG TPA: hypothetical protein VLF93_02130 [Candidatus Saccharimonadales bacterium]|nr:hypothetical protein [Candidatus Saccharimonadales bacterium]